MMLTPRDWHARYTQQAKWTSELRRFLYSHIDIDDMNQVLEVGCGTGVISMELNSLFTAKVHGLDIEPANLHLAATLDPQSYFTLGDAHSLPYPTNMFDLTLCHFLLLWVMNPIKVVQEMARVTRTDGYIIALAEPDYGGRIDYPDELDVVGKWQQESLYKQGADAQIGRRLAEIFNLAQLSDIQIGVLGGQWSGRNLMEDWSNEWQILENDYSLLAEKIHNWEYYKSLDRSHRQQGDRILFVPTFYAYGKLVP